MSGKCIFIALCFTALACQLTYGRQMCLSCQYLPGQESGQPCNNDPWNWPMGNVRMRCNSQCTFQFWLNTDTETITYSSRGCSATDWLVENGCVEDKANKQRRCYYNCDGVDYCNNWNATEILFASSARSTTTWNARILPMCLSFGLFVPMLLRGHSC